MTAEFDTYVAHPSFVTGILGRVLVDTGYTVAVISQSEWRDWDGTPFQEFSSPNIFCLGAG